METRKLHRGDVVTGVLQNNRCEFLHDDADQGIDVRYDIAKKEFDAAHEDEEDEDCCEFEYDGERGEVLIGYLYDEKKDEYYIDEQAEYSAIVDYDYHYTTQIIRSKYAVECNRCSPCYPGQGDIDTPGDSYIAFCPPPDCYGDQDEMDKNRIFKIEWVN